MFVSKIDLKTCNMNSPKQKREKITPRSEKNSRARGAKCLLITWFNLFIFHQKSICIYDIGGDASAAENVNKIIIIIGREEVGTLRRESMKTAEGNRISRFPFHPTLIIFRAINSTLSRDSYHISVLERRNCCVGKLRRSARSRVSSRAQQCSNQSATFLVTRRVLKSRKFMAEHEF